MVIKPFIVFCIFNLFACSLELFCQEVYPIRGTVFIREGIASKVNLTVKTQESLIKVPVDNDGNFLTYLEWNNNYLFSFSKSGYVSKSIYFSTKVPSSVDKTSIYPYEILIELFPMFPNVDTAFFKKPIAKIHFNNLYNDFYYDADYQLSIKYKLEKTKTDYNKWLTQRASQIKPKKEEISKKQEISALHYQNAIGVQKKKKIVPAPTTKKIKQPDVENNENPFHLPPLRKIYPQGKTVEIHLLKGREITRVIINRGVFQKIFYKVKHDWGGSYYFVQESPTQYRSISKYNFEKSTNI